MSIFNREFNIMPFLVGSNMDCHRDNIFFAVNKSFFNISRHLIEISGGLLRGSSLLFGRLTLSFILWSAYTAQKISEAHASIVAVKIVIQLIYERENNT